MTYEILVFQLSINGITKGKYMHPTNGALSLDQWLEERRRLGYELHSLTDIAGQIPMLRVVVKQEAMPEALQ